MTRPPNWLEYLGIRASHPPSNVTLFRNLCGAV
jgi:hypothetical protein